MNAVSTLRPSRRRASARTVALASICTALLATAAPAAAADGQGELSADSVAAAASAVSNIDPQRLVQSTGNLYWTSNVLDEFDTSYSSVYRASKSGSPGGERLLYRESHDGSIQFDAVAYANVSGVYYGYVVVNNLSTRTSVIKRFPLDGGAATTVATSPQYIGDRDLVADNTRLFWADAGGLRTTSVNGGAVQTPLYATTVTRLALSATRVYFAAAERLRTMAKTGGDITTLVTASTDITALHLQTSGTATLYWGLRNNEVKSRPVVGGVTTTHQAATADRIVRSVSYDGSRILWISCSPVGNSCSTVKKAGATVTAVATGRGGSNDVQGDATAMYWGDHAVQRYTH